MKNNILNFQKVYLNNASSLVGKKEFEGPLGHRFDAYEKDEYFGCDSFEDAESEMIRRNINLLIAKAKMDISDVDMILGGDLINQCTSSSYAIVDSNVPYIGLYGACSTAIEAIICGSAFISNDFASNVIAMASSNFCGCERQYRFPLEYGSTRTPTSQNTVTGTGAFLLSQNRSNIKINSGIIGKIVNKGVTDANNMGAAMACAATDTIIRFFDNSKLKPNEFDYIITGDLGFEGNAIAREMLSLAGYNLGSNFTDCGMMIYDQNSQDTHSGGSGCGCIASVLAGHFIKLFEEKKIKNILAVGTGALLNPNSVFAKKDIPAIAHAVHITSEEI